MEELKPCPFCGKPLYIKIKRYTKPLLMPATHAAALRDELIDITGQDYVQIKAKFCPMCGRPLDRRAAPENKPLTVEQLKQMDNQPVWTEKRCGVVRADPQITRRPGMPVIHFNYGWEWADDVLACGPIYAHKPEGSERT